MSVTAPSPIDRDGAATVVRPRVALNAILTSPLYPLTRARRMNGLVAGGLCRLPGISQNFIGTRRGRAV
jgi:hypothetical protein